MEKGQAWLIWAVVLISVCSVLLAAGSAHADTVLQQQLTKSDLPFSPVSDGADRSVTINPNTFGADAGTITRLILNLKGSATSVAVGIACYETDGTTPCSNWSGYDSNTPFFSSFDDYVSTGTGTDFTFTFSGTPSVQAGQKLYIRVTPHGGNLDYYGSNSASSAYFIVYGGSTTPPNTTTRIISTLPGPGATTTPTVFSMQYYVNSSDLGDSGGSLWLSVYRADFGQSLVYATSTAVTTTDSVATWDIPAQAIGDNGVFYADFSIHRGPSQEVIDAIVNAGGNIGAGLWTTLVATSTTFYTGTSPWPDLIGASSTNPADLNTLATSTCDVFNIAGCFQNALVWAFTPSPDSMQRFVTNGNILLQAPPAGYIGAFRDAVTSSFATTTASSTQDWSSSQLYFLNFILEPVRTVTTGGFWVFFAIGQYLFLVKILLPSL